jgi:hypothetical protein
MPGHLGRVEPYAAFEAFFLAAQYFLILRLTALLAAADIPRRLRAGLAALASTARPGPRFVDGLVAPFISSDEIAVRTPSSCRTSCCST